MKTFGLSMLALGSALLAASPAAAQNAFQSFNGTQGAGNFYYGEADSANPGVSGTFFTPLATPCAIAGTICLQEVPNTVPGVYKTTSGAFQTGSVLVPGDRLILHPAQDDRVAFAAFVAPTAGTYNFTATFSVQDVNPSGVDLFAIDTTGGALPLIFTSLGSLNGGSGPLTFTFQRTLGASGAFGVGVGRQGTYFNDSTGLQFQASAVPEPATWGMMMLGFGMVGYGLRSCRNSKAKTTVRFA